MYKLYHNKNCSKSRKCLLILNENNITFELIEYMKNYLTTKDLKHILKYLADKQHELVRVKNKQYKQNPFDISNENEIINFLKKYPSCMQRPIFFDEKNYFICRPPEKILMII